jgi:hypothetical protein
VPVILFLLFFAFGVSAVIVQAAPEGVFSVAIRNSERRTANASVNVSAQGGNITRLNVSFNSQTSAWQGFAGNISGNIVLDDATGDHFYTWTLFNVSGEIYASRNTSLNFNTIYPTINCSVDQVGMTGIGADRTNRTYSEFFNVRNFSVGTIAINSSTACAARPYVNSSNQTSTSLYENIILNSETSNTTQLNVTINNTIYVGILELDGTTGFDAQQYNFQLLVPVNKSVTITTYAFYAELD